MATGRPGPSERWYRALLHLYPGPFRSRYADEMVTLFGDQLRDARRGTGIGVERVWLATLRDLAVTIPAEHTARQQAIARSLTFAPTIPSRLVGALGIIGGLLLVAPYVPIVADTTVVQDVRITIFLVASIVVVLMVHRRQSPVAPRLTLAAAVPAVMLNIALIALPYAEGTMGLERRGPTGELALLWFWAAELVFLADAWFGLVAWRLGVVTRWGAGLVAFASLLVMLGNSRLGLVSGSLGELVSAIAQTGIVLAGIGWIWLGVDLATRRQVLDARSDAG
jgi:hypothetical protein